MPVLGKTEYSGLCDDEARWSSGQDGGLSRRNQEFDSPTGHQTGLRRSEKLREKSEKPVCTFRFSFFALHFSQIG